MGELEDLCLPFGLGSGLIRFHALVQSASGVWRVFGAPLSRYGMWQCVRK